MGNRKPLGYTARRLDQKVSVSGAAVETAGGARRPPLGMESSTTTQGAKPWRILHLEDNAKDLDLIRKEVQEQRPTWAWVQATTEKEFHEAWKEGAFDLVLLDHSLPGYGGLAAMAWMRAEHPEVPCLFVSGTIGEERAIETLKKGATDYVLKDKLDRLVPAMERAIQEAEERVKGKRMEEALRNSEERFREMAETIRDVFWVAGPDGSKLQYVSPAYEIIWGRPLSGSLSEDRMEAVVEEDRPRVSVFLRELAKMPRGTDHRIEYRIVHPNGQVRWIEDRGFALEDSQGRVERTIGVAVDITDRKLLEAQLLQAQKMEAVGQLAGGVAHDFNNLLTVITGLTSVLLDAENLPPDLAGHLKQIYTAGERAAELTRQLLVFSRKQPVHMQTLQVNDILQDISKMLRRVIGEHITLELKLATPLPFVQVDAGMIEQVLMNLAVNARDAMPRGGRLMMETGQVALDAADLKGNPSARAGHFVVLRIQDTGEGIPPEVMPHIFEPFYTTKEVGRGTGLGLATVFSIVKQHQGWIAVESEVHSGTVFHIYLPAAAAGLVPTEAKAVAEPKPDGGKETILLVEDEPAVREFAVAVLQKSGYRILQAASGADALEVWKWHAERIDLLLTDMIMPGNITGLELAETLQKEKPDLRVICTSGYSSEMMHRFFIPRGEVNFIHKPYQPRDLAKAVRDALDRKQKTLGTNTLLK
jgi:two-component system cell cycle sensor histidine kinase/response regulator CckA